MTPHTSRVKEPELEKIGKSLKVKLSLFLLLDKNAQSSRLYYEKKLMTSDILVTATEQNRSQDVSSFTVLFTCVGDSTAGPIGLTSGDNSLFSQEGPFSVGEIFRACHQYKLYIKKCKRNGQSPLCPAMFTNLALSQEALVYFERIDEGDSTTISFGDIELSRYRLSTDKVNSFVEQWVQASEALASNSKGKKRKFAGSAQSAHEIMLKEFLKYLTIYMFPQPEDFEEDLDDILKEMLMNHLPPSLQKVDIYDYYLSEIRKLFASDKKSLNRDQLVKFVKNGDLIKSAVRGVTQFYTRTLDSLCLRFEQNCFLNIEQFIYNQSNAVILNVVAAKNELIATALKIRDLIRESEKRSRQPESQPFSLFVNRNMLKSNFVEALCEYFTIISNCCGNASRRGRYFLVVEASGPPRKDFPQFLEKLRDHFLMKNSPFGIVVITAEDDESLADLQNISRFADTELKWRDLSATSQNYLLDKQVYSQGSRTTLQSLMVNKDLFVRRCIDFNVIMELIDVCDLTLDFEFGCCEKQELCVPRLLRRYNILDAKTVEFSKLVSRIWLSESDFEAALKLKPNVAHHLVSQFGDGKPDWLVWHKSSGSLAELRDFLIGTNPKNSAEYNTNATDDQRIQRKTCSVELRDDQFLDHLMGKREECGKIVLVSGKDRFSIVCILSNLAKRICLRAKVGHLPYWIVRCDGRLPPVFERLTSLDSNRAVNALLRHLVKWSPDRDNHVAKALLQHRLENAGGRIVLMFDGEVEDKLVPAFEKVMRNISALPGVERVVVACCDSANLIKFEDSFNQFAYHITDVTEDDCSNVLVRIWSSQIVGATVDNSANLIKDFANILLKKCTFFSGRCLIESETMVKITRALAQTFQSDVEHYVLSDGQELCGKLERPSSILSLVDVYRELWNMACSSLPPNFLEYIGGSFSELKCFLHYHAMLSLQMKEHEFLSNRESYLKRSRCSPALFHDLAFKTGLVTLSKEGNVLFFHDSLRDYFIADYFYALCSKSASSGVSMFDLFYCLLEAEKFQGVLKLIDDMLRDKVRAIDGSALTFDQDPIFAHRAFNDSIVKIVDPSHVLNMVFDYGFSNIFCWLLTCAKEKLTRASRDSFHDDMLEVFSVQDSWKFVIAIVHSNGRTDPFVVTHILKWFENGGSHLLEELFKSFSKLARVLDTKLDILEQSYDVLRVVVQFIISRLDEFSRSFIADLFIGSFDTYFKIPFLTLLAKVKATTPCVVQIKKQILCLLPSVLKSELTELLCAWFKSLEFSSVRDRLFLKQCTLFMCHYTKDKHQRVEQVLKHILKTDPRILLAYNKTEEALVGKLESWEHASLTSSLSTLSWLDVYEKYVLSDDAITLDRLLRYCKKDKIAKVLKALNVGLRTGNKEICDLLSKTLEQTHDREHLPLDSVIDCIHSSLHCALSSIDEEWIDEILEAAEPFLLSNFLCDTNLLLQFAESSFSIWQEKRLSECQFLAIVTKIVTIWEKKRDFQSVSNFFSKVGYQAFEATLQTNDALLELILESVLKSEGTAQLIGFIFSSINEDDFVERACQLLSNQQVREFVLERLDPEGLKTFVEWVTQEVASDKENTPSVWKAFCSYDLIPSLQISEIVNRVRERCGIDLPVESPKAAKSSRFRPRTLFASLREADDTAIEDC